MMAHFTEKHVSGDVMKKRRAAENGVATRSSTKRTVTLQWLRDTMSPTSTDGQYFLLDPLVDYTTIHMSPECRSPLSPDILGSKLNDMINGISMCASTLTGRV
jgi:hypothetical protein